MHSHAWSGLMRSLTVISLFLRIFLSFYLLRWQRLWHRPSWVARRRASLYATQARRFRLTAVELGGLLIKLGQFLSSRVDILPRAAIDELAGLQDEVRPADFAGIRAVISEEFGRDAEEVFPQLEAQAVASASLGQVHRAVLPDGQTVAVKVMRPGIERLVRIDLRAVGWAVGVLKRFTDWECFIDLDAIFQEFEETIWNELDYELEGRNAERIRANFQHDSRVVVPRIVWEYTTRRVLTMEFVHAIKITDYQEMDARGIDRSAIARKLLQVYVRQVLVDGFFHADPHPGNLFVTFDGRVAMVDFGMVGSIDADLKQQLVEMAVALVKRDYPRVIALLQRMGFLRVDADTEVVGRAVAALVEETLGTGQGLGEADLMRLLEDLETLLYEQPFQLPARFTFLGRALGTLYGICVGLDPNFNFLDEARPFLAEFMPPASESFWKAALGKSALLASSLVELPPLAERVLQRAERGDLAVRVSLRPLAEQLEANTRALQALGWAVVLAALLVVTVQLELSGMRTEARLSLAAAAACGWMALSRRRSSSRPRRRPPLHPPPGLRRRG